MSTKNYTATKYLTLDEALKDLGFTTDQINSLAEIDKSRYIDWITEANGKVEADTFPYSDQTPLVFGTQPYTYAKNAALNWFRYKKRDNEGSPNAKNARDDYKADIEAVIRYLKYQPTQKEDPTFAIQATSSLSDIIQPYSQYQGFPPDTLF